MASGSVTRCKRTDRSVDMRKEQQVYIFLI
jgi:hypothetical protein